MQNLSSAVSEYLNDLPPWKKDNLSLFRKLVHKIIPDIKEDIKWGVPVFINNKQILFAMSAFKDHTKYNFIQNGALIDDKDGLFNNGLESKKSRGIDLRENEIIDEIKLESLILKSINVVS